MYLYLYRLCFLLCFRSDQVRNGQKTWNASYQQQLRRLVRNFHGVIRMLFAVVATSLRHCCKSGGISVWQCCRKVAGISIIAVYSRTSTFRRVSPDVPVRFVRFDRFSWRCQSRAFSILMAQCEICRRYLMSTVRTPPPTLSVEHSNFRLIDYSTESEHFARSRQLIIWEANEEQVRGRRSNVRVRWLGSMLATSVEWRMHTIISVTQIPCFRSCTFHF